MSIQIKHCRIRINFYFFALLCVISFFDRSGMLLAGLLSALLHECGHLTVMLLTPGQAPSEISVTPFGIRIYGAPLAEFTDGSLAVLTAGSGANFLIGGAALVFSPHLAALNFVMGAMNLLPVDTLDGGGIVRLLLRRVCTERTAEYLLTALSLLTLTGMALAGVGILCRTGYNFSLLAMSLWLLLSLMLRLTGHSQPHNKNGSRKA